MWFSRLFKRSPKPENEGPKEPSLNQGIFYLYLIIILQAFFVLALVGVIMFVGKVLATPLWVFLAALLAGAYGCVHIYRKARQQFHKLREAISRVDLADRNYEISIMGGVLTMRVEQNPRRLWEAPAAPPLLESDTIETPVIR